MAGGVRSNSHLVDQVSNSLGLCRREPMDALEVARVLKWRERTRASWQACADYCGRNVEDVRKACEAVLRPVAALPKPKPPEPTDQEQLLAELKDGALGFTFLWQNLRWKRPRLEATLETLLAEASVRTWRSKGGGRIFALPRDVPPAPPQPARRKPSRAPAVLAFLREHGPATSPQVADGIGEDRATIATLLSLLAKDGRVARDSRKAVHGFIYSLPEVSA